MLERLIDIEVSEYGAVTEEIELVCTMTGFRCRFSWFTIPARASSTHWS